MIKELIYQYFDNERLYKEKKQLQYDNDFNAAPSYLTDCKRKLYYKKMNIPASNPTPLHSYIKFAMGDAVHEKLQNILSKIIYFKKCEVFQEKELYGLKWVYRLDGSFLVVSNEYILEIKSIYGTDNYNDLPKDDNIIQLFSCMLLENKEYGDLLYICRDTGFIEEFIFTLDDLKSKYGEIYKKHLNKIKELKKCIEEKKEPDRDYELYLKNDNGIIKESFQKDNVKYKTPWQCSKKEGNTYCQWRDLCWSKELEEIKNHSFFINGKFE